MGRIVKVLSLVLVSLVLVFGTGIEADAKKKKKKVVLTAEETAMFDKCEVKPKNGPRRSRTCGRNLNLLVLLNVMVAAMTLITKLGKTHLTVALINC